MVITPKQQIIVCRGRDIRLSLSPCYQAPALHLRLSVTAGLSVSVDQVESPLHNSIPTQPVQVRKKACSIREEYYHIIDIIFPTNATVVIGSVTIGNGGSSSISTGPSKELYITVGQVGSSKQRAKSDTSSSELSSVSSESAVKSNDYRLQLFGSSNTSKAASYDRSETSRCTMPMTQAKFERVRFVNNMDISFVDWKAASRVISEYRNPTNVTDVVAAQRQKQFFFDMYTSHVQSSSSDSNRVSASSLDSCVRYDSKALEPSTCEVALLVPWRRGGFSGAFRTSDGKPSEESESSRSLYMENWARKDFVSSRQSSRTHPGCTRSSKGPRSWCKVGSSTSSIRI